MGDVAEAATIEILLTGAALAFEWKFAGLAEGRTRLPQVVLNGEEAGRVPRASEDLAVNPGDTGPSRIPLFLSDKQGKHKCLWYPKTIRCGLNHGFGIRGLGCIGARFGVRFGAF